jgi:hypothetical protein
VRRIVKGSVQASLEGRRVKRDLLRSKRDLLTLAYLGHVLVGVVELEDDGLVCAHVGIVVVYVRSGAYSIAHLRAQHVFGT